MFYVVTIKQLFGSIIQINSIVRHVSKILISMCICTQLLQIKNLRVLNAIFLSTHIIVFYIWNVMVLLVQYTQYSLKELKRIIIIRIHILFTQR